jgi:hypothetical protein
MIVDLQVAINRFLEEHNAEPKPFTWTAVTGGENPRINGASLLDRGFLMGWRGGYYTGRIGNACASEVVVRLR